MSKLEIPRISTSDIPMPIKSAMAQLAIKNACDRAFIKLYNDIGELKKEPGNEERRIVLEFILTEVRAISDVAVMRLEELDSHIRATEMATRQELNSYYALAEYLAN